MLMNKKMTRLTFFALLIILSVGLLHVSDFCGHNMIMHAFFIIEIFFRPKVIMTADTIQIRTIEDTIVILHITTIRIRTLTVQTLTLQQP